MIELALLQASIVREEGVGALWKGALPRACWTAPLGAMNFAGALTPHVLYLHAVLPSPPPGRQLYCDGVRDKQSHRNSIAQFGGDLQGRALWALHVSLVQSLAPCMQPHALLHRCFKPPSCAAS